MFVGVSLQHFKFNKAELCVWIAENKVEDLCACKRKPMLNIPFNNLFIVVVSFL